MDPNLVRQVKELLEQGKTRVEIVSQLATAGTEEQIGEVVDTFALTPNASVGAEAPVGSSGTKETVVSSGSGSSPVNHNVWTKVGMIGGSVILIGIAALAYYWFFLKGATTSDNKPLTYSLSAVSPSPSPTASPMVAVPQAINPVSPTAIPLGDGKVSNSPKVGYVDSCINSFPATGGAAVAGSWLSTASETWNSVTKIAVQGSVNWPNAYYSAELSGTSLIIKSNDLPVGHATGTFPIAASDPAHSYDGNPNHIAADPITWMLPANPTAAAVPKCTGGGAIGILNDGVFLFNALDGEGRDAGAHEVLDSYQGHPDMGSTYHHHTVPNILLGTSANKSTSVLVGYALDGYGIYVERDSRGNLLTNTNLDACHGRTSDVLWQGKMTNIYHYNATLEYPYTVGCFHGSPIAAGVPMKM
jgi:hypothetical protein